MMLDKIEELKEYFKNQENVVLAFLFGSQANSKMTRESDFDIAIWIKNELSSDNITKIWRELEQILNKNVDLVILNSARPTVTWSALRGKKLLIKDFKLYLRLFLDASREAEDIQDFMLDFWNLKKRYSKA